VARPAISTQVETEAFQVVAACRLEAPVVELSSDSCKFRIQGGVNGDVRLEVSGQMIHWGGAWAGLAREAQADPAG